MVLEFQGAPDWLIQQYMARKSPAQEIADTGLQALQTFGSMKERQNEQKTKSLDAYTKLLDSVGPDVAPIIAKKAGIFDGTNMSSADFNPQAPTPQPTQPVQPSQNPLPTPTEQNALQSLPQDHPLANEPIVAAHIQQTGMNPLGYSMPTQDQFNKWGNQGKYGKGQQDKALAAAKFGESLQTAADKNNPKPVITDEQALAAGSIPPNAVRINPKDNSAQDTKNANEQDRLEQQAIDRISKLRGDASLSRVETQRDAAIQAYNTIDRVQKEGRAPSKLEYYDLLGQMWKARTGAAPTDQALKDLDQKTLKGDLGNAFTYFAGKPAGATTQDVLNNIKSFAVDSGLQADKFHSSYMQSHRIKPSGLEDSRWQPILNTGRGLGFAEATGYQPTTSGGNSQSVTKTINGQTFVKQNGQWYHQ